MCSEEEVEPLKELPALRTHNCELGFLPALGGPHHLAGVVVDHHGQIAVPALVGDFVDPDPAQTVEAVRAGVDIGQIHVAVSPSTEFSMNAAPTAVSKATIPGAGPTLLSHGPPCHVLG